MTILLFLPIVLSLMVLCAHFLRFGATLPVVGTVLLLGLLFIKRAWAARIVQAALVLATVEWLRTILQLTLERMNAGAPYARMVVILGIVAAVTLLSALLFQSRRMGQIYGLGKQKNNKPRER